MQRHIYEEMEIPDFASNTLLLEGQAAEDACSWLTSFADVLEDAKIRQLHWDWIEVGAVLGRGGFGVVKAGVYKEWARSPVFKPICSNLSSEKIAIKELLMDDAEFCSGRFSDFLKEIVVMRWVWRLAYAVLTTWKLF